MGDTPEDVNGLIEEFNMCHPGWHAWEGVGGTGFYARRPKSSPPIVVRENSLEALAAEIEQRKAQQDRWDWQHSEL